MYAAIDERGQLIQAETQVIGSEADLRAKAGGAAHFYCPRCRQPVQLVRARTGRPFFRHVGRTGLGPNETARHRAGKQTLQQELAALQVVSELEVVLPLKVAGAEVDSPAEKRPGEVVAPLVTAAGAQPRPLQQDAREGEQRRADVLWQHGAHLWAFEFQCAPLELAELRQRHEDYQRWRIREQWLLGATYLSQRRPSQGALKFMAYQAHWGYYLAFWQPERRQIQLFYHCQFRPPRTQLLYQVRMLSLGEFLQGASQNRRPPAQLPPNQPWFDPRPWLGQQLALKQPRWLTYQGRCYQQGWDLQKLPTALWLPQCLPPVVGHWPDLLGRQLDYWFATGGLTRSQQRHLLSGSRWPLLTTELAPSSGRSQQKNHCRREQ